VTVLTDLRDSRELLLNLTLREIRSKYKRTALGQVWSLVNPLATLLIYTVVFALVFRIAPPVGDPSGLSSYALWLVSGLLAFNFFSSALVGGMSSLLGNANLIKKVYFPRDVLVTSTVLAGLSTFATEMVVLIVVLLIVGAMPLPFVPVLVLAAVVLMFFTLGLALALSVLNVYFRDTQHFISIALQILFYASPVLYPLSYVEDAVQRFEESGRNLFGWQPPILEIYQLNPLERFLAVFRALLYDNRLPDASDALYCVGSAVAAMVLGYVVFRRYEGRLAEEL
jgi:ABC-type polysaccharide/polyol phosphate export permease